MCHKSLTSCCLQAEADRIAREEQEKREHEEYLKLKEAFTVEEEGEEVVVDTSVSFPKYVCVKSRMQLECRLPSALWNTGARRGAEGWVIISQLKLA